MSIPDESWAEVARDTRAALRLLGRPIKPACLPDEPHPCGASFALHAAAHFATIKAIADHQLDHLGPDFDEANDAVYLITRAELERCDQEGKR